VRKVSSLGDNEPYSVTDASDYTIPVHGEQRDLPTMWHSKFAKTSSRPKRVNEIGGVCLRDCFRKLMSGSSACRSQSKNRGLYGNAWTPIMSTIVASRAFVFVRLNEDKVGLKWQAPTLALIGPPPP